MLPPLASVDDLEDRLTSAVADEDETRAVAALIDASALVRSEAGKNWVTTDTPPQLAADLPDIIVVVTLAAARRAFENPTGITQKTAGDVSISYASRSNAAVFLTADECQQIRRAVGKTGLFTITTTRGEPCCDTIYVPETGTDTQFPWYAVDDPLVYP